MTFLALMTMFLSVMFIVWIINSFFIDDVDKAFLRGIVSAILSMAIIGLVWAIKYLGGLY